MRSVVISFQHRFNTFQLFIHWRLRWNFEAYSIWLVSTSRWLFEGNMNGNWSWFVYAECFQGLNKNLVAIGNGSTAFSWRVPPHRPLYPDLPCGVCHANEELSQSPSLHLWGIRSLHRKILGWMWGPRSEAAGNVEMVRFDFEGQHTEPVHKKEKIRESQKRSDKTCSLAQGEISFSLNVQCQFFPQRWECRTRERERESENPEVSRWSCAGRTAKLQVQAHHPLLLEAWWRTFWCCSVRFQSTR